MSSEIAIDRPSRVVVRFPDLARQSSRQGFAVSATRFYFPIEDRQSNVWIAELSH